MKSRSILSFDLLLFGASIGLIVIGVLFVYSSAISSDGVLQNSEYIKQIIWGCFAVVLFFLVSFFDYKKLKEVSLYIYLTVMLLLVLVLIFGKIVNGARSWISIMGIGFQPSEFMKTALILQLGVYFADSRDKHSDLTRFLVGLAIMLVPMALILAQPDMGTSLVFIPIFITMAFVAGIKKRYLFFMILFGSLAIFFTMLPAWDEYIMLDRSVKAVKIITERRITLIVLISIAAVFFISGAGFLFLKKSYFYWICFFSVIIFLALGFTMATGGFLKDYQMKRLIIFLDPQIDPRGDGWNVIQSITAVGSGGPLGKGFLQGTQSHYRYLPEQSTDFIFSIISEEWGFVGCMAVFLLFLIIMLRGLYVLLSAKEPFGLYIGSGVIGMIFFHFAVNIGMTMGIMPITGIPLLLVSYGGSSISNTIIGIGLISSIYLHKYKY